MTDSPSVPGMAAAAEHLSCAVATCTIGRPLLRETIESVRAQSRLAHHYVFVHGREYWESAKIILDCYPDVHALYLPHNGDRNVPGKGSFGAAPVYAMAPFVVAEDIIFYLDDDNTYERDHISFTAKFMEIYQLQFSFALRNIIDAAGVFICQDNCESLGYFPNITAHHVVDNSCFAVRAAFARRCAYGWYKRTVSDRNFFRTMCDLDVRSGCTAKFSVNYRLSHDSSISMSVDNFIAGNQQMLARHSGTVPWATPTFADLRDA